MDCKGCLEHTYSAWDACKFLSHYNVMSLGPWKHPIREEKAKEMHKEGPRTRVELALGLLLDQRRFPWGVCAISLWFSPFFGGVKRAMCRRRPSTDLSLSDAKNIQKHKVPKKS